MNITSIQMPQNSLSQTAFVIWRLKFAEFTFAA
jgi:hypothetical protein